MERKESRDQRGGGDIKKVEKEVVRMKGRKNWMKSKVLEDYAFFFFFFNYAEN